MATEAPDPRTFKSWEDAFNYPVPVVRKLEAQLRANANDNRERLRSLVGASYRDLLGTAERIVEMDQTMGQVELVLGRVGTRCNSGVVNRLSSNSSKLEAHWRSQRQTRKSFASQLSMLQTCPTVISRQMKKGGSLLLAAKVLVLSRLLHRSLSSRPDNPPFVDTIRERLGSLRERLLARVDKHFSDPALDNHYLVDDMCAFSLATSSTPTAVLEHFHRIRLNAINNQLAKDMSEDMQSDALQALRLCIRTLRDTQAIFPQQLSQALARLKAIPLIQAADVQSVAELNLPVHQRWVVDEVRTYTPYTRHDELHAAEAEKILRSWAKQGIATFVAGLDIVTKTSNLQTIVELRQNLLETWFPASRRAPGLNVERVLDDVRDVINKNMHRATKGDVNNLKEVTNSIRAILNNWNTDAIQTTSLWNLADNIDLSNGAQHFKNAVVERSHGRSEPISKVAAVYVEWAEAVGAVRKVIKNMKELRWDDDFDDDPEDDELGLDAKQDLLSEDDPRMLEEVLSESFEIAFAQLQTDIESIASDILGDQNEDQLQKTLFVLRIFREINQELPQIDTKSRKHTSNPFPVKAIEGLHSVLAIHVIGKPTESYGLSNSRFATRNSLPGRQLWDNAPAVPSQPTPGTYKLLFDVNKEMASLGGDVWSPGAVRILKDSIRKNVQKLLSTTLEKVEEKELVKGKKDGKRATEENEESTVKESTVGEEKPEKEDQDEQSKNEPPNTNNSFVDDDLRKDKIIQLLFDASYLDNAFTLEKSSPLLDVGSDLGKELGITDAIKEQISKNAVEYWKKTYLMFALLA